MKPKNNFLTRYQGLKEQTNSINFDNNTFGNCKAEFINIILFNNIIEREKFGFLNLVFFEKKYPKYKIFKLVKNVRRSNIFSINIKL